MNIRIIEKLEGALSINGSMASRGSLFLFFSLLLLLVKPGSEIPVWESIPILSFIPTIPVLVLRVTLFVIVLIFTIAFLHRLENCLKGRLKKALIIIFLSLFVIWLIPPMPVLVFQVIFLAISATFMVAVFWKWLADKLKKFLKDYQYIYWAIFGVVFSISFLKGLSSVPVENFVFPLVAYIGFAWFFVIMIIFLRAAWQPRR